MLLKATSGLAVVVLAACAAKPPVQPVSGNPVLVGKTTISTEAGDFVVRTNNHQGHGLVAIQEVAAAPELSLGHWNDGVAYVADGGIKVGRGAFGTDEGRLTATKAVKRANETGQICGETNGFRFSPGKLVEGLPRPEAMFQGQVAAWIFGGACK